MRIEEATGPAVIAAILALQKSRKLWSIRQMRIIPQRPSECPECERPEFLKRGPYKVRLVDIEFGCGPAHRGHYHPDDPDQKLYREHLKVRVKLHEDFLVLRDWKPIEVTITEEESEIDSTPSVDARRTTFTKSWNAQEIHDELFGYIPIEIVDVHFPVKRTSAIADFKRNRKYCEDCGMKCEDDGKCPKCDFGALVIRSADDPPDKQCSNCGTKQYFTDSYCDECGSKLPETGYEGGTLGMMTLFALEQDPEKRKEMENKFNGLGLKIKVK